MKQNYQLIGSLTALLFCHGCSSEESGADVMTAANTVQDGEHADTSGRQPAVWGHAFETFDLETLEEVTGCLSWTLENDDALYVERFEIENDGAWHHSNWFVVPEDMYPGPDGFWDCDSREFSEVAAASAGAVIGAQSTQSLYEEQFMGSGVVIKIPPRHKVVAGAHMLNLAARPYSTQMRIRLHAIHPADVQTVVVPFRVTYYDLTILPGGESRFTSRCLFREPYETVSGSPMDFELYWLLPHYHALGNFFEVKMIGGPRDGETLLRMEGFDAEGNGKAFDPPVNWGEADGIEVTCGFNNPRDEAVGWGIGDQEMCEMLGLAKSQVLMDMAVREDGERVDDSANGIPSFSGPCTFLTLPPPAAQSMPTDAEKSAPMAPSPTEESRSVSAGPPVCEDTPSDAAALTAATLGRIQGYIFTPSCSFSSCHGGGSASAGLNLETLDLHNELMAHQTAEGLPLVVPGDASSSPLYQRVSRCTPQSASGETLTHMPLNSPKLMAPELVALIRDWINDGALDN